MLEMTVSGVKHYVKDPWGLLWEERNHLLCVHFKTQDSVFEIFDLKK